MFYLRIGPKKARLIFIALLILAVVALGFCTSEKGVIKSCYDDADERRNFIRVHGFETADDYTVKTVTIPLVWSDVYENYNKLQKNQGYDLSLFKGETVTQYTYEVTNYPSDEVVLVHLLVYDGVIIGADVMSTAADGFMQGLK
ncbi:MAG: DUF4830 domain-containing protein [Clostridia bacterium]|nr:DUF4830 domain-containing protein [Clostridia bacterium]